jgi:hypothetical protein
MTRKHSPEKPEPLAILADILAQGVIRLLDSEKQLDVPRDKSVCPDVLNDAEDANE